MTVKEARKIVERFYDNQTPDKDDVFMFTEALSFLIEAEHDPKDMIHLGGHYYGAKRYDKAL
jgi:hypothetical protein